MIKVNFFRPRKPFKRPYFDDWKRKWSMDKDEDRKQFSKLTDQDVIFCRKAYPKFDCQELASMFKVHPKTIRRAVTGETFIHLNGIQRPKG